MTCEIIGNAIVCFGGGFKEGDPAPTAYWNWHVWAKVQYNSGLRQVRCGMCSLWKFPQELSGHTIESKYRQTKNGPELIRTHSVCISCTANKQIDN